MALLVCLLGVLHGGCAHYEYDVLRPAIPEPRAGTKEDLVVQVDPLSYHFRTADNRLVMRVFNMTSEPIEVIGVRSAVIDPTGQSRPVKSQLIPPGAFVKFVLPPVRPEFVDNGGVRVGGGVGFGGGMRRDDFGFGGLEPPERYTLRDGGEYYWDWEGESQARMVLVFKRGNQEFTQEFLFGRRRV